MAEQLAVDYRQAELHQADRLLCDFAVKLTLAPERMEAADINRLREAGFDDQQITIAVQVIAYFNYINRIADGLGVDHEDWMRNVSVAEWHARRGKNYLESLPN